MRLESGFHVILVAFFAGVAQVIGDQLDDLFLDELSSRLSRYERGTRAVSRGPNSRVLLVSRDGLRNNQLFVPMSSKPEFYGVGPQPMRKYRNQDQFVAPEYNSRVFNFELSPRIGLKGVPGDQEESSTVQEKDEETSNGGLDKDINTDGSSTNESYKNRTRHEHENGYIETETDSKTSSSQNSFNFNSTGDNQPPIFPSGWIHPAFTGPGPGMIPPGPSYSFPPMTGPYGPSRPLPVFAPPHNYGPPPGYAPPMYSNPYSPGMYHPVPSPPQAYPVPPSPYGYLYPSNRPHPIPPYGGNGPPPMLPPYTSDVPPPYLNNGPYQYPGPPQMLPPYPNNGPPPMLPTYPNTHPSMLNPYITNSYPSQHPPFLPHYIDQGPPPMIPAPIYNQPPQNTNGDSTMPSGIPLTSPDTLPSNESDLSPIPLTSPDDSESPAEAELKTRGLMDYPDVEKYLSISGDPRYYAVIRTD